MPPPPSETILADDRSPGIFGFFREITVRETIESFVVAIILALLFRAYEAEAFIIPTGSMAPSLNGQHVDLECENCGLRYHSGASTENGTTPLVDKDMVASTACPICQFRTELQRGNKKYPDHRSNSGDRILVNKFIYDFSEPQRYDVIVFKNPNNGKQNYIKRLIGLPGENILVESGDIYLMERQKDGSWSKSITRKPPRKLRHVLQVVDDTHHIGRYLKKINWPSRWQNFSGVGQWEMLEEEHPVFTSDGSSESWLRYRHFMPRRNEWATITDGSRPTRFRPGRISDPEVILTPEQLPPGELITDQYGYNSALTRGERDGNFVRQNTKFGHHWVGDIGLECWVDVQSDSGELLLDIVEGGAHFTCAIDVGTGTASLSCDDSAVDTKVEFSTADGKPVVAPSAATNLRGAGDYHIEFVNADDQIHLWINNRYVEFDAATYRRTGFPIPTYSATDPGDAEPLGVGTDGAKVRINRLKVVRDIYYTSVGGANYFGNQGTESETGRGEAELAPIYRDPTSWGNADAMRVFRTKKGQTQPMFQLEEGATPEKDQFLPMGDNSPASLDGRVWSGPKYVERDMLIGRALFVYWPHPLNSPIPFFPNFGEMGFIR